MKHEQRQEDLRGAAPGTSAPSTRRWRERAWLFGQTAELWLFSAWRAPLIFYLRPRIRRLSRHGIQLLVPLSRRTKNHQGSMYFGALATGADLAPGILTFLLSRQRGRAIDFAFRECTALFLRRARGDVTFSCEDGAAIDRAIERSISDGQRCEVPITVAASCVAAGEDTQVATFEMRLSLRAAR